jgi:hypothetical protein
MEEFLVGENNELIQEHSFLKNELIQEHSFWRIASWQWLICEARVSLCGGVVRVWNLCYNWATLHKIGV